ncbi:MAG: hypothetical protein ACP5T4_00100 [Candidatus Micrarchaeia archaeon]
MLFRHKEKIEQAEKKKEEEIAYAINQVELLSKVGLSKEEQMYLARSPSKEIRKRLAALSGLDKEAIALLLADADGDVREEAARCASLSEEQRLKIMESSDPYLISGFSLREDLSFKEALFVLNRQYVHSSTLLFLNLKDKGVWALLPIGTRLSLIRNSNIEAARAYVRYAIDVLTPEEKKEIMGNPNLSTVFITYSKKLSKEEREWAMKSSRLEDRYAFVLRKDLTKEEAEALSADPSGIVSGAAKRFLAKNMASSA